MSGTKSNNASRRVHRTPPRSSYSAPNRDLLVQALAFATLLSVAACADSRYTDDEFTIVEAPLDSPPQNRLRGPAARCAISSSTGDGAAIRLGACGMAEAAADWSFVDAQVAWTGRSKCLDVPNGSTIDGTRIQLWNCVTGNTNQRWKLDSGRISWGAKCLHVDGTNNGAAVITKTCAPVDAQRWRYVDGRIRHANSDRCLDVVDGVDANGTKLQIWDCSTTNANQRWDLRDATVRQGATNKCLDLKDGITVDGQPLQAWTCATNVNANQRFNLERNRLKVRGKCVATQGEQFRVGATVAIATCSAAARNQDWFLSQDGRPPVAPLDTKPERVTGNCTFGGRCARDTTTKAHSGADEMTNAGNVMRAICDGVVKVARGATYDIYDRFTIIEHEDCGGYAKLVVYYGHTEAKAGLAPNVRVKRGELIGTVSHWPNNTHLHLGGAVMYVASGWGYPDIGVTTASTCGAEPIREDGLGKAGWIDMESFGTAYGWWSSALTVSPACNP